MKASELIERLKEFPADAEVFVRHPSHDYWRTELAGIADDVSYMDLEWSEYHRTDRIVRRDEDEEDQAEEPKIKRRQVVIDMRSGW